MAGSSSAASRGRQGLLWRGPGRAPCPPRFFPRPADPAMVLAGWLRAAGVAAQVAPASVEEAAALWRSVTADRPAGVLTDDAASAGQVRPLVPAAGLIVVKSRHRLPPPSPPIAKIGNC